MVVGIKYHTREEIEPNQASRLATVEIFQGTRDSYYQNKSNKSNKSSNPTVRSLGYLFQTLKLCLSLTLSTLPHRQLDPATKLWLVETFTLSSTRASLSSASTGLHPEP